MRLIILILLLSTFYNCKAQTIYPLSTGIENISGNNYYIKDIDNVHDSIVGVWKWEDGNSMFELTLEEFEQYSYPNNSTQHRDTVFGKYKYIENGFIIAEINEIVKFPDLNVEIHYKSSNSYRITIYDIVSRKHKVGDFTINTDGTATMTLQDPLYKSGIRTSSDPPPPNIDFQLPTNITLTKIN